MNPLVRGGVGIVLGAAALRLAAVGFGLPLLLKPDENRMVEVAYAMGDAGFRHWFLVYPHLLFLVDWVLFMAVFALGWTLGVFPSFKAFRVWRHAAPHVLHLISRLPVVAAEALTPAVLGGLAQRSGGTAAGVLAAWLAGRAGRAGRACGLVLIAGAVAVPAARSLAYVEFLAREDTRKTARRFAEDEVPAGTAVAMIGCAWVDIQLEKDPDQEDPYRPERHAYLRLGRELALAQWLPRKTYRVTYASDLAAARAAGSSIAVLADHPWHPLMRRDERVRVQVAASGTLLWSLDPIRPGARPTPYGAQDAWLVPTSGFTSLTAPGPRVWIYRLR